VVPDTIPASLRGLTRWVAWRWEPTGKPEKPWTKVPVNAKSGRDASSTNPATWGTFDAALAYADDHGLPGVGFVLADGDDLIGIDRDGCVDPETGAVDAHVAADITALDSYTEFSVSGTGVHTLVKGVKPPGRCKEGPTEIYSRARFLVVTGHHLAGTPATVNERQAEIDALYARTFPAPPRTPQAAAAPTLTLDDHEIIDRLRRQADGGKASRLLAGEMDGYASPSEARGSLSMLACFYSDDAEQIARIVASSTLFTDGTRDRERSRKATLDATTAVANYTGARFDPDYRSSPTATVTGAWNGTSEDTHAAAGKTVDTGLSRDELLALVASHEETISRQIETITRERERRVAAEARAEALSLERSRVMRILRAPDLSAGQKLTAFGTVLDLGARISNGEAPTPAGYKLPAIVVSEKVGMPVATVQRHLRDLDKLGIIRKTTIREESTPREHVDQGTGEILTVRGMRDITYITIPDGDVGKVIDAALAFRRPEDAPKHGGARVARCVAHPDADIVRTWQDTCGECGVVLDEGQAPPRRPDRPECKLEPEDAAAVAAPPLDLSRSSLIPEPSVAFPVYRGSKLEREEPAAGSGAKLEPGPCVECGSPLPPGRRYRCASCAPVAMPPPGAGTYAAVAS